MTSASERTPDMLQALRAFARRNDAAVSVLSALVLPALLVTVGLAVEYGNGLLNKARDQRVADAAAFAGATVYAHNTSASLTSVADTIATLDGLSTSDIAASLVTSPSGDGRPAVKVVVTTQVPLMLSQALGNSTGVLSASATSYAESAASDDCVLSLDPSGNKAAQVTGGTITLNCSLQANSSSSSAFSMSGGSLTANNVNLVGQSSISGGTLTATLNQNQASVSDPYSGLYTANSVSSVVNQACPSGHNNPSYNTTQTIGTAGGVNIYCGGLTISNGTVTLNPGVFVIQGGTFNVSGGTVTGSGVTIILTCQTQPCTSASNNWAQVSFSGGTSTLSAPTSGSWSGMLFYQDPTDSLDNGHTKASITGGSNSLQGILYFPDDTVDYTGGASASTCTEIINYDIDFTGGGTVNHNCASAGVGGIGTGGVRLVQ